MQTATFLADVCGADAFTVATLEEAIALRRSFNAIFAATMVKETAGRGGRHPGKGG